MTTHAHTSQPAGRGERPRWSDRIRSIAMAASTAAFILTPTLGPVVAGTGEDVEEYDTDITPPRYAFVIWAPIFAAAATNAAQHLTRQTASINRRTGWWLTGAYAVNAAWSVTVQSGRFQVTPYILPPAAALTAVGYFKAQGEAAGRERLVPHNAGLLLGWTSVASIVNFFAAQRLSCSTATSTKGRKAARGTILAAASGLAAVIISSKHGYISLATTSAWAFITNAANPRRTFRSRAVNAVAGGAIVATSIAKLIRDRTTELSAGAACERKVQGGKSAAPNAMIARFLRQQRACECSASR